MRKNMIMAAGMALLLSTALMTGCGSGTDGNNSNSSAAVNNAGNVSNVGDAAGNDGSKTVAANNKNSNIFAEMSGYSYTFSSGAGGWATEMNVKEDGTFSGKYHDSELGESGKNYPNGTVYMCDFTGKFASARKVDDYTYKTRIENISYNKEVGKEELKDNMRYVYTTAYGLDDAVDIYIYVKGTAVSALPEEYCQWVNAAIDGKAELPFYGIYNENAKTGFSGWSGSTGSGTGNKSTGST